MQAGGLFSRAGAKLRRSCAAFIGNGLFAVLSPLFKRPRFYLPAALVLCALVAAGVYTATRQSAPPELAFSDFLQEIDKGQVKQVRFADGAITLTLASGATARTIPPPSMLATDSGFVTGLAARGVRIEVQQA